MANDVRELLDERQKICGDYADHARILILTMELLMGTPGWLCLTDCQKETIYMTIFKYARVLSGDPRFLDHWRDVVGYNQLIVDQLRREKVNSEEEWFRLHPQGGLDPDE